MLDEITFVPAYAGQFLKNYKSHQNVNSLTNDTYAITTELPLDLFNITISNEVQFPDVSFWQGEINWDIMATKTKAVIIRIGQAKFVDAQFERNYAEARKRGLRIGFYFFFDDRYSPGEQATTILKALQGKQIDMELFIDWENSYGGQFKGLPQVVALMQAVEAGIPGVRIGMYTGYYWFRENSNAITHANQYTYLKNKPLWLAWYTSNPVVVLIPAPWTSLAHWQWGTPAVEWGQGTKELDMNYCGCNAQEFVDRYGRDEGGNEPMRYKVVWNRGVGRRLAPHTGTVTQPTYTGLVYEYLAEVEVIEENIPDALDPTNPNKVWVKFADMLGDDPLYGASQYPDSLGISRVRMEKIVEPPPVHTEPFVLKVEGFKEFRGVLEQE